MNGVNNAAENGKWEKRVDLFSNIISKIGFPIVVTCIMLYANFTTGKEILETLQRIEVKINQMNFRSNYKMEYKDYNGAIRIKQNNKTYSITGVNL